MKYNNNNNKREKEIYESKVQRSFSKFMDAK